MTDAQLAEFSLSDLTVPNTQEDILRAHQEVIYGRDLSKMAYVAMTMALSIFTRDFAGLSGAIDRNGHTVNPDYLRYCFSQAMASLEQGKIKGVLENYVSLTRKLAGRRM